jgi:hypothetical protein
MKGKIVTGCIIAHTDYKVTTDYVVILSAERGRGCKAVQAGKVRRCLGDSIKAHVWH